MNARELTIFLVIVVTLLCVTLFALWHIRSRILALVVSGLAGFLTYFVIAAVLSLTARESLAMSAYGRVFGLAPLLAHAADPNWSDQEGLVLADPWLGRWVEVSVRIGFWTLVFAAMYIMGRDRTRKTI